MIGNQKCRHHAGPGSFWRAGFAVTMPEFHLTDLRIIDPFEDKSVICILPFAEGKFGGQKPWARMQKSSIERVSGILRSLRCPSSADTWIVETWHFHREVGQYRSNM
jgi:hypothetical protein